ncbi:acetamidase/formamidase family protein [Streptomyces griseorubiginosus]|uniref:acetamidase/formamidase family protein n=1 Tax=Streptomyces griseorubiginosus TaxID=67304 RepID=UPI001AD77D26|nr:acetamidase/formamidase family protein [Streptomyces griseorubiginosus]MBO4254071.1 acetamidase [Streptomyces griseorubiginosus]
MNLLQPGLGPLDGDHYLPADPSRVHWGLLPNATAKPALTVRTGETVTFDTVSHEGILEDQGRDPAAFFGEAGIPQDGLLHDAVELAASSREHEPSLHGPHVVTGPVAVQGARPGDVLEVEVLTLHRRAPYGVISNRHGKGALPGEYPLTPPGEPSSLVATVGEDGRGRLPVGDGRQLAFPLRPFLGIMGVAPATESPVHSVPPGPHGGNIDVRHLGTGARLFLPVQVPDALFYAGDPHFAQGDGEVSLTAFEAPLRATLRLTVHRDEATRSLAARLRAPFAETATEHIVLGLDRDLDEALRNAVRDALTLLTERFGIPGPVGLAYLSAAADFHVSQVVDIVKGVHGRISKADLTC